MLVASGLFFAVTLAWHDSLVLSGLSFLGLLLTLILAFSLGSRQRLQVLYVYEAFEDLLSSSKYSIISYYDLVTVDIQWKTLQQRWGQFGQASLKGLLITVPLILLFGLLFTASDARFEDWVKWLLDWGLDLETVVRCTITFVISSWIAAAVLRGGVLKQGISVKEDHLTPPASWTLGSIEIVMILGALNLLFLSFIAVQFTYFFGGDALVQSVDGPTYADYARRGFFQLVTVAVLVMTLLLFTHWLQLSSQLEKRTPYVFIHPRIWADGIALLYQYFYDLADRAVYLVYCDSATRKTSAFHSWCDIDGHDFYRCITFYQS
jgi:hypothetical protein